MLTVIKMMLMLLFMESAAVGLLLLTVVTLLSLCYPLISQCLRLIHVLVHLMVR